MYMRFVEGVILAALLAVIFIGFDVVCYAWDSCAFIEGMR